jgi:hypothetical protein
MTVLCRLFPVFLLLAAACSRAPEEIDSLKARQSREEAARTLAEFEQELMDQVPEITDIFQIETLKRQYRRRGGYSGEILELLAQRKDGLIRAMEPVGRISPEAEILTSDYRKIEEGAYQLSLLFRVNKEFDQDYRLSLHGYVEQSLIPLLPSVSQEHGFAGWTFEPLPPTSVWDRGKYVFISTEFNAQSIPYYLKIGFSRQEEGRYGQEVDLGWKADLEETEESIIAKIGNTEEITDIYELYRRCLYAGHGAKTALDRAKQRLELLLGGEHRDLFPSPEAKLVDFRYRMICPEYGRLYYLFLPEKDFPVDFWISLRAYLDSELLEHSANNRMGNKYENWNFYPLPPTTRWPVGEMTLITCDVRARPLPYRFVTGFYQPGEDIYGERIDLGWWGPEPVSEEELLEAIQTAEDVFELARLKRLQGERSGWTSAVDAGFRKSWAGLAKKAKPNQAFSNQVDLVAFDYKRVGEDRYRLSYLFDVKEKIDADYWISIHGYVDDDHLHYLPEERRQHKFSTWSFAPDPAVSTWRPGEKVLVTTEIIARPIPYNIVTGFSPIGGGDHRSRCEVGWYSDSPR